MSYKHILLVDEVISAPISVSFEGVLSKMQSFLLPLKVCCTASYNLAKEEFLIGWQRVWQIFPAEQLSFEIEVVFSAQH
jgi:hypothetical protein